MPVVTTPTKNRPSKRTSLRRRARNRTSSSGSMGRIVRSARSGAGGFRTWMQHPPGSLARAVLAQVVLARVVLDRVVAPGHRPLDAPVRDEPDERHDHV